MKRRIIILSVAIAGFIFSINAQEDEARQQDGLPRMIGRGINSGEASVSGVLTVTGIEQLAEVPPFFVSVYSNGRLVVQREIKNRSAFHFQGIPIGSDAVIVVETTTLEIKRIPILLSDITGVGNLVRQDILITAAEIQGARKSSAGVINARYFYKRSSENQKLFDRAVSFLNGKKKEESISLFKQITENDPKDFIAWSELGTALFSAGKLSEAENAYSKALEQKPDYIVALVNVGKLCLAQKNNEKAIEILTKAVATEPNSPDANHYLGEAYLQIKKGSKAVVYLNEAIKLAPIEKAEIHLRLASLYHGANLKDRAANEYKMYLEKVPKSPEKEKLEKYIKENTPKK